MQYLINKGYYSLALISAFDEGINLSRMFEVTLREYMMKKYCIDDEEWEEYYLIYQSLVN